MTHVSVLIPVHNAGPDFYRTLRSVLDQQHDGHPLDVILVDDGSTDGAVAAARESCPERHITVLHTSGIGAAAAMNVGLGVARGALLAQVDQDVVLHPGWLAELLRGFDDPAVVAVQGQYITDNSASLMARVMGRDLQERYAALDGTTSHVCTGNVVYRSSTLRAIGGFEPSMGYGYDNDVSYRLRAAGGRLRYCSRAHSTHRWRDGVIGYARQQYGFGYGRLDVVAKHRNHILGDTVSPAGMMVHPVGLACALAAAAVAPLAPDGWTGPLLALALALIAALLVERAIVGVRAARRFHDWTPLLFPLVHLLRDVAWVCAIVVWSLRRVTGVAATPAHSMWPRRQASGAVSTRTGVDASPM